MERAKWVLIWVAIAAYIGAILALAPFVPIDWGHDAPTVTVEIK